MYENNYRSQTQWASQRPLHAQTGTGSVREFFRWQGLKLPVCVCVCVYFYFAVLEDGGHETE